MSQQNYRPKVTSNSWLYTICQIWFYPALWLFYRDRTYNGKENLLRNKPLFIIPNHQNAFMDALAFIPVKSFWQFAFLMRAKSFEKKAAAKFLNGLNMLPIYRQMDGADLNESNNEVFKNCAWLMERNRPIICWAEGTHSQVRRMRPIKKGPLRFAFAAEEKNNWTLDVHFVPVGMNYTDREHFGGDFLANIGKPIPLSSYRQLYEENPARALNELKKEIEREMEKLAIHIPSEQYYEETEWLREMAINDFRAKNGGVPDPVKEFEEGSRAILQSERLFSDEKKASDITGKLSDYRKKIEAVNVRDKAFAPAYKTLFPVLNILLFVLLFPVFAVGYVLHVLPPTMALSFTKKIVRDPAFNSSILWLIGTLLYCLLYVIMFVLVGVFTGNWWYALASWPAGLLLAAVTLWYKRRWNRFSAEQRLRKYTASEQGKKTIALRQEIMSAFYAA